MNKQNNLCYLCSIKTEEFIEISNDNGRKLQIAEIVSKHLQFMKKVDYAEEIICNQCWSLLSDFHQFYIRIENVHEHFEMEIIEKEPDPIEGSFDMVPEDPGQELIWCFELDDCSQQSNSDNKSIKMEPEIEIIDYGPISEPGSRNDKTTNCDNNVENQTPQTIVNIECVVCNEKFITFSEICNHYQTVHNQIDFVTCCGKRFYTNQSVRNHRSGHIEPLKHVDPEYPPEQHTSTQHQSVRHPDENETVFQGDQFNKRFIDKYRLRTHIKQSHGAKHTFKCDVCVRGLPSYDIYEAHMKRAHKIFVPPVQCEICGVWILNQTSLRMHMKTHTDSEQTCKFCSKILNNRQSLRLHCKEAHSEHILFKCTICPRKFRRELALKEHMALHNGVGLYSCSLCTKTFQYSSNLYNHRKTAHRIEYQLSKDQPNSVVEF